MEFSESVGEIATRSPAKIQIRYGSCTDVALANPLAEDITIESVMLRESPVLVQISSLQCEFYDRLSIFVEYSGRVEPNIRMDVRLLDAKSSVIIVEGTLLPSRAVIASIGLDFNDLKAMSCDIMIRACSGVELDGSLHCKLGLYRKNPLTELADRFGSDKGSLTAHSLLYCAHGYGETYNRFFKALRESPVNILEIGLHTQSTFSGKPVDAPSLRMWEAYFSKAAVYGFDQNDYSNIKLERSFIFRGDQSSRGDLNRVRDSIPRNFFDIIIDDGSHQSSHQQISLAALFPLLRPGGLYVIEDLSWQPDQGENPKTAELLREWGRTGVLYTPFISQDEAQFIALNTRRVHIERPFLCETAVIQRREI